MNKRKFMTLLGGAAALPFEAQAQPPPPVRPLIGVLSPLSAASAARNIAGFRSGLRDLGYLEGRNAALEIRYGDGAPERMAPLAQELVALKPDVLMAGARSGALAAQAQRRRFRSSSSRLTTRLYWELHTASPSPVATSPEPGSTTTRWSASGWNFSSSRCPHSRASRSS